MAETPRISDDSVRDRFFATVNPARIHSKSPRRTQTLGMGRSKMSFTSKSVCGLSGFCLDHSVKADMFEPDPGPLTGQSIRARDFNRCL